MEKLLKIRSQNDLNNKIRSLENKNKLSSIDENLETIKEFSNEKNQIEMSVDKEPIKQVNPKTLLRSKSKRDDLKRSKHDEVNVSVDQQTRWQINFFQAYLEE